MPFTNAEKRRRFRARLLADPCKMAEYKTKRRQWRKKKEDVRREREPFAMVKGHVRCMLPLCHPFTAIISGPTGCGKTAWVLRLIDNIREKIEPVPSRIWYYFGEYQSAFNNYVLVHFEEGLPHLSDKCLMEVNLH